MSINDDDPLLKLHESLKKEAEPTEENPVVISSSGDIGAKTNAQSLKEALQTLVKYAKMLEEKGTEPDAIPQKMLEKAMEDDVPVKD